MYCKIASADSELLELKVSPYCGAANSVIPFDEYKKSIDLFVGGYRCRK